MTSEVAANANDKLKVFPDGGVSFMVLFMKYCVPSHNPWQLGRKDTIHRATGNQEFDSRNQWDREGGFGWSILRDNFRIYPEISIYLKMGTTG
jgi:hypothetical protein